MRFMLIVSCLLAVAPDDLRADNTVDGLVRETIQGARTNTERAKRLLDAAQLVKRNKTLYVALLTHAVDYGMKDVTKSAARAITARALEGIQSQAELTAEMWAAKAKIHRYDYRSARDYSAKVSAGEKLLEALQALGAAAEKGRDYRTAGGAYREAAEMAGRMKLSTKSELTYRGKRAAALARTDLDRKRLIAAIKKDPNDIQSRTKLLKMLIRAFDAPAEAAGYLVPDVDETWRTYVKLAAQDPSKLKKAACGELAKWYYESLTGKRDPAHIRATGLQRAKVYYARYMELHGKEDAHTLRIGLTLKKIDEELTDLGILAAESPYVDLLAKVDVRDDSRRGTWIRKGVGLVSPADYTASIELSSQGVIKTRTPYQLLVCFARTEGERDVAITFPIAGKHLTLVLDRYGHYSGLEYIDSDSVSYYGNSTRMYRRMVSNKKVYTANILVKYGRGDRVGIMVHLNGNRIIKWEGNMEELEVGYSWRLKKEGNFGLGSCESRVVFNKAQLKVLK
jgi:hypothetical protein